MRFYLDTNVILSLLDSDSLTPAALAWLEKAEGTVIVSRWALCEWVDVLHRKQRDRYYTASEATALDHALMQWIEKRVELAEGDQSDFEQAYRWLRELTQLRSKDALHIAMAKRLNCTLVTGDALLMRLSGALGLSVTFLEPEL